MYNALAMMAIGRLIFFIGVFLVALPCAFAASDDQNQNKDNKVWTSETYKDPEYRRRAALRNRWHPNTVSGAVRLASGEVPYPAAEIFFCGMPVGSTDKRGRFNVKAPPTGGRPVRSCRLSILHPGMKVIQRSLPSMSRGEGREIRVGTLTLQPLPGYEGGATVSITTLEAPKAALRAYREGVREESRPKPDLDKAASSYRKAVDDYPRFAEAWNALARVRLKRGNEEEAILALETAISADESFAAPRRMLLRVRMKRQQLRPAAIIAAGLLQLSPGDHEARYFHALATFGLGRWDESTVSARILIEENAGERFPQVFQILGEIHADRDEIEQAAAYFRTYLQLVPEAASAPKIRARLNEWQRAGLIPAETQEGDFPFTATRLWELP